MELLSAGKRKEGRPNGKGSNVLLCSVDHFGRVNRERLKFFSRLVKKSDFHFSLLWLLHGNRIVVEKTGRQETIQEVVQWP